LTEEASMSNSDDSDSGVYTRRQFLTDIGKAGGAGVMYGAMGALGLVPTAADARSVGFGPMPPLGRRMMQQNQIVILGAGIAGLAAAYELNKLGYSCLVLEARGIPGGRNWTVRGGDVHTDLDGVTQTCNFAPGQYMNCGPARLPQHHVTIDYCRELGVQLEVFTNQNADGYYYSETAGNLSGKKVRHRAAKADYFGYVSELLSKATNDGALNAQLSNDDKTALIQFLRSFGGLNNSSVYTASSRRGYKEDPGKRTRTYHPGAGTQAGTVDSPSYGLSDILQSRLGLNFSFEAGWDQAMLMFQPVGGMDRIAYALEREVKKKSTVIYNAEVTGIRNTATGVEITYRDPKSGAIVSTGGAYCICTIPPQVVKNIDNDFDATVMTALNAPSITSTGKIGLQYKRRWWEEDEWIMGGITNTTMLDPSYNPSTIWYPSFGYLGKKGVIVGYYNFGATADNYAALSPAQRAAQAVLQGKKIHGDVYETELENHFSVSWRKEKYSEGGWVGWSSRAPGSAYQKLLEPAGRVYFAGDHLSYYIAWQAGAFESARKVVKDIHARVTA
jgi:monoamine oxidase